MNHNPDRSLDKPIDSEDRPVNNSRWRKKIIAIAILLLGSAGIGLIYGWYFTQRKLIPLIETEVGNYLRRPLELGELKSISLTEVSFGSSALPATAENPDFVEIEAIKVDFAPLHFLVERELKLDLTLLQPDIYIEQDESKLWTPTDFGTDDESGSAIKVNVQSIRLEEGQLALVAYNSEIEALNPAVVAEIDNALVRPVDNTIEFDVAAQLIRGGKFVLDGQSNNQTGIIDLDVIAQQLDASEISNLLALPIELKQGSLDGKLGVTLSSAPIPELQGTLDVNDVSLQIPGLVKPFSNSEGKLQFKGRKIELDNVATNFGQVSALAAGSLDLAESGDYQINAKIQPVAAPKAIAALELDAPVPIRGKIKGDVAVRGTIDNPVVKLDLATASPSRIDKVDFKQIDADLELVGTTLSVKNFAGLPKTGGKIEGNGKLELDGAQNLAFKLRTENVSGKAIARSYNQQLPVDLGLISGQTKISAQGGDLATLSFEDGSANFALGNGTVEVNNLDYANGIWSSRLTASGVEFGSLPIGEGSTPTIAKGLVDGVFEISGTNDLGNLNQVDATGRASLNTVGGQIAIPNLQIADGNWKADADTQDLKLQRLFPELPDEFNDNLSGEFYLTGNIPDAAQPQTLISGFGDLTLAEGKVKVEDLKIVDQNWSAIAIGSDLKLKELSSSSPEQFAGLIDGRLELSGTTDNITPQAITATGNGSLTLPEGVFIADELAIADGQFQAQITPQNVALSLFADPNSDDLELNGQLGGQLAVTGQVDNLSPTAVTAEGNLSFSKGIDLLEQPLSAAIVWDGKRLDVLQATGNSLNARGHVILDESFFGDLPDKLAAIDYFEFDVPQAQGIDIKKLRLTLPSWATNLNYSGRGEFSGTISGVPSAMNIQGDLGLRNLRVEDLEFDPLLAGKVQISPETGVRLSLQEISTTPSLPLSNPNVKLRLVDKIELILDSNFSPVAFAIAQDDLVVTGAGKDETIDLTTQNVPVELLKTIALKSEDLVIPENVALQPVDGELSGNFTVNLDTLRTTGKNVVVTNPALASIRGDRLEGDFQYADGYFTLQDVEFQQRNSTYKLEGNLVQQPDDIELDGRVVIDGGQIQDILVALQIFELTDFARIFKDRTYGAAQELYSSPSTSDRPLFDVGFKDAPIMEQLQLLSAIQAWLASVQQERQNALVPAIEELTGTFDGQIKVSGSLNAGLSSEFDFLGEQWRWGKLVGEQIVARGNLQEGILTLLPISVKLQDTTEQAEGEDISPTLLFTGTFGGETQSGQFRLVEVPVKLIEQLFNLPPELAFNGLINANASIAGTQDNPQARGEININDASLNETSIQTTKGSFNYRKSRLNFSASSIIAEDADPLIIKGSIPYQLPFAQTEPESDRLELQLNVKDKGLALLDIFSRGELKWIDGEGNIVLDVAGVFDAEQNLLQDLVTQGTATIENATIAAKSLPKNPITNINSQVFFDFDNIRVNHFQGNLGGGEILAAGTVPLSQDVSRDPLTIDFDDVEIEVPKLYNGGIKGELQILGRATQPSIGGDLILFDGTIFLDEDEASSQAEAIDNLSDEAELIATPNTNDGIASVTQYNNLQLRLGEDIQISQPPIFTFLATGDLTLNGTILQPSPKGTIVLKRGQVNLFTTQLSLSRDYKNTARFTDNNLLDPSLDILLTGSAIETTNRSIPSEVLPTEIPDSTLGTLETIRISAKVKGLASNIINNIELTSSPDRSRQEIAALLGGGFVEGLAGSNGTLGLATLAGSAIFGSLNAEFNNIFPIGEIRLFPTPIIEEDRDKDRDGLAGEIAFELIDNLSFSALKILNTDIPAQFGFRYRLDDNFVLRGSSDFQEDGSRALIEYEHRF
ncbi:translocation/assembly module TamB domain-containing protein [Pleurocapsales cyanobacterium LEGE 10410]|nr:translocation/assembly module TamB domain-containing protein [Pleurocapsales cyanobacterium LEGE 10410]